MIKSNACPYCGAPYTIADGGCRDKCRAMQAHQRLVNLAAACDPGEEYEVYATTQDLDDLRSGQ